MSSIIGSEDTPKAPYTPPPLDPIGDRVVVQADLVPEVTKGGIALPNAYVGRRAGRFGTVVAVGPGQRRRNPLWIADGNGQGKWSDVFPMQCKIGDRVIVPQTMDRVQMDLDVVDSELLIVPEGQLMAIMPPA